MASSQPAWSHIREVMQSFNRLRAIEGYYLRNAAVSLSQGIVRASFNCDGTYIVNAAYFPQFVARLAAIPRITLRCIRATD